MAYPMEAILASMDTLTSYAEIQAILRDRRFLSSGGRPLTAPLFLRHTLVVTDGPEHLDRRRLYMPFSRPDYIATLEQEVAESFLSEAFRRAIVGERDGGVLLDITRYATVVTVRLAARVIGLDIEDDDALGALSNLSEPLGQATILEYVEGDLDAAIAAGEADIANYWNNYAGPAWERRSTLVRAAGGDEARCADLPVDLLTLLARKYAGRGGLADELALRDAFQFFAAITRNLPTQVANVFVDLWDWLEHHPEDTLRIHDDAFLRDAIVETMRLHINSSPVLIRQAAKDVTVVVAGRPLQFRQGDKVALSLVDANRDEAVFGADADRYDPHRPRRVDTAKRSYGAAFGDGAHTCPGKQLVLGAAASLPTQGVELMMVRDLIAHQVSPHPGTGPVRAAHGAAHFLEFIVFAQHTQSLGLATSPVVTRQP